MRKFLAVIAGAASAAALVVGVASLKWYVWDIVIGQSGEADRSMLFWGLPIAFLSVALFVVSFGLFVVTRRLFGEGSRRE